VRGRVLQRLGLAVGDRLVQLLEPRGCTAWVLDLPDGADLNNLAQTDPDWFAIFEGVPT